MKLSFNLKAALIIFGLGLVFFSPFIFSDQLIVQSDQLGSLDARVWFKNSGSGLLSIPLWWPSRLGGIPTLDATFGDSLYPLNLVLSFLPWHKSLGYKMVLTVIIAGLTALWFFRKGLGFGAGISLICAILYMFNTNFISHLYPGHDGKMYVISLLPIVLLGLVKLLEEKKMIWAIVMASGIGLSMISSHIQLTYLVLWGVFLLFLFETTGAFRKEKSLLLLGKRSGLFAAGIALGLGLGMVHLYPPIQYVKAHSVRGDTETSTYEHATSWSLHPEEVASLLVPEFGHFTDKNQQKRQYWGRNPFKLNSEYAGILPLLFGIVGLIFLRKNKKIIFWLSVALAALIYALGANTPFFRIFFHLVPGVSKFRAPSMIMFWFATALIIVTGYVLTFFQDGFGSPAKEKQEKWKKGLMVGALCCLGFAAVCSIGEGLVKGIWTGVVYPGITSKNSQTFNENYPAFLKGLWINMLICAGILYGIRLLLDEKLQVSTFLWILGIVAITDLWRVDANFFKLADKSQYQKTDFIIEKIKKDKTKFRVFDANGAYPGNFWGIHNLESVNGFHDNELRVFREFRGGRSSSNFLYRLQKGSIADNPFLNLMNVKYLVYKTNDRRNPVQLVPNPGALPRVFAAPNFRVVDSGQINSTLRDPNFSYRTTVLLSEPPPEFVNGARPDSVLGKVKVDRYKNQEIRLTTEFEQPGFIVIGDNYFPAWKAEVNGRPTKVLKAYGAIRAIPVPAGKHQIRMFYSSNVVSFSIKIFLMSLLTLILGIFWHFYSKKAKVRV